MATVTIAVDNSGDETTVRVDEPYSMREFAVGRGGQLRIDAIGPEIQTRGPVSGDTDADAKFTAAGHTIRIDDGTVLVDGDDHSALFEHLAPRQAAESAAALAREGHFD